MKVFLTGATGYIGSVVAEKLLARGHKVLGLARNEAAETKLRERGIEPLRGDLKDVESLKRGATVTDATIHTAFIHDFSDYDGAVQTENAAIAAFADALTGTNKPFIATTGSGFLGDTREATADEYFPYDRNSPFYSRGESEQDILKLSQKGIRSVVLRLPFFVYGRGGSSFVPFMIGQAQAAGAANYVGAGNERVSVVHVEDAADLYILALETSTAKNLYNVSAEIASFKSLNEAIARLLDIKSKGISAEEAQKQFGAMFGFLSINNQLSAEKAQRELGWKAKANMTITDDIENGSYRNLTN
ncbi:MAG: SDR family oxidoreductase [Acidobacteria bacterium]|jgi:nucleoside-diphosphate-sugar epimerase|nr:SDR family oxidoreductase [Acidobacteriota bacterium]